MLAEQGHDVLALVRSEPRGTAAERLAHKRIRLCTINLEQPSFEDLPGDVEAVVSVAQSSHHRDFPARAREMFAVNVASLFALVEWARANGVRRFVHASSGGIYGPAANVGVKETDPVSADERLGFYLSTKLCTEALLRNYGEFFHTLLILRPFFIYGPGQGADMLIPRLIASVREGRPIRLQGLDGPQLSPIYVDDAAAGFAAALRVDGSHVVNLGGPDAVRLRALGEQIGALVGRPPAFEAAPGVPSDYAADTTLAGTLLGRATTRLADGLAQTVQAAQEVDR